MPLVLPHGYFFCALRFIHFNVQRKTGQCVCINVDLPWPVLDVKLEVRQLPEPPMAYCIELGRAHHVGQGVVVGIHREVLGVE